MIKLQVFLPVDRHFLVASPSRISYRIYMVNIQAQFIAFHEQIKLSDENEDLRLRRDVLIDVLKNKLGEYFKNKEENAPVFEVFNQGSYAMHTGTIPLEGDYD